MKLPHLAIGLTNCHRIWHGDAHWPSPIYWPFKFRTFKNPRWRMPYLGGGM